MDFETLLKSLNCFLKQSDSLYLMLYAVVDCILTQAVKKLFINKTKAELLHKFDFAEILPFLFGVVFAVVDLLFVLHEPFGWSFIAKLPVTAVAVGALATVIFKTVSAATGKSLKSLMKDDAFCVFYTQLMFATEIRSRLSSGDLSLSEFVVTVKAAVAGAKEIYSGDKSDEEKLAQLKALLAQNVGENTAESCGEFLHKRLLELFGE